jgi:hypothetical protein
MKREKKRFKKKKEKKRKEKKKLEKHPSVWYPQESYRKCVNKKGHLESEHSKSPIVDLVIWSS